MGQPPPTELLSALDDILLPLERKYESLRFALQNARLSPGVRQPTERGMAEYERVAEQELMLLDQDERVRLTAGAAEVRAANADQPKKLCHFFNRPGGCNRNPCPFAHVSQPRTDKPAAPKPKAKPGAKPAPKSKSKGKGKGALAEPKCNPRQNRRQLPQKPLQNLLLRSLPPWF